MGESGYWIVGLIIAMLVAGLVGYGIAPTKTIEKEVEKIVEVPVEKIVEVEVEKECPACDEVASAEANALLGQAVKDMLYELEDDDELECDGEDYDVDEVEVRRIYDAFKVVYEDEDEYTVTGKVKLNFKQDDEKRCRETVEFSVYYEEGEDPEVEILAP